MIVLTKEDIAKFKSDCLKRHDKELLAKVLEMEDYCYFHKLDGLSLDIDWRRDREEELQ